MNIAPHNPAHRNVHADDCTQCDALAGRVCEPYCYASLGVEFMTAQGGHLDALVCVDGCGNQCCFAGFYPVLADGSFDPCSERWHEQGQLMVCADCGRVISQLAVLDAGQDDDKQVQVLRQFLNPPSPPARW